MLTRIVLKSPQQRNFSQKSSSVRSEIHCGDCTKTARSNASGRMTSYPEVTGLGKSGRPLVQRIIFASHMPVWGKY
jgi:hypothetical protein